MKIPPPNELLDFRDKVILVTGGGSGMGSGLCDRFAQAGASIVVNYHSSSTGAEAVVENVKSMGRQVAAFQADVTDEVQVKALFKETVDHFGRLDVLVNNAGIYPMHSLMEMSPQEWDAVVDANLRSVFLCTQAASRQMIAQGSGGAVVNIASIEAENPAPMHSHYNAAKGGVVMFTKSAANELGQHNIRVNAVSPGLIWREGLDADWPDGVTRYQQAAPLGRLGLPEDVADACLFLASPAARWITGANLVVDGGVMTNQIY
jgi:NAD(P)-dependent dehydrogenase (short-subunit alcohol dehydrogenase family)